jgi:hypothetical protein
LRRCLLPRVWWGSDPLREQRSACQSRLSHTRHGPRHALLRQVPACAGKIPVEVAARWRSPLPSLTFARVAARGSSRTFDRSAHLHVNDGARDPPDLGAIPDAFRSLRPGSYTGFPLLGLSKDRPSIVQVRECVSRVSCSPRLRCASSALRDGNAGSHPRSVLVVSHHLDGFVLLDPATIFRSLPILGFIAFPSAAKRNSPQCSYCPSKLFLRRQLRESGDESPNSRGRASPSRPSPAAQFTANLSPSSFLFH